MKSHATIRQAAGFAALALGCIGCKSDADKTAPAASAVQPEPSAVGKTAAAGPGASDTPEAKSLCKVESHEVIAKNTNQRTGITTKTLDDGRILVGMAVGNRPNVVVFDGKGVASRQGIVQRKDSELAKAITKAEGRRDLQRVTPVLRDGRITAYADYRDKYKSGRRRISCGPADGDTALLEFDGTPVLDELAEEKKGAGQEPPKKDPPKKMRMRLPKMVGARPAPGAASAPTPKAPAEATLPPPKRKEKLREIRDCRTFSDAGGKDVWSVGSELVGKLQKDGEYEWKMQLFSRRANGSRNLLFSTDLGSDPKKLHTHEAPIAEQLADGSFVLTARYKGGLYTWLLSLEKKRRAVQPYRDGYPSLPRMIADGMDHLVLTSHKVKEDRWQIGFIRLTGGEPQLPTKMTEPTIDVGLVSHAEPTLAKAGNQRWLALHGDSRRSGKLFLVPVDANLASSGPKFEVESGAVYESHVFGIENDKLLVVYVTRPDGSAPELVADVLSCQVPS